MKSPKDIDAYLATIPPKPRAALERLRRQIRGAAPQATEGLGWGMPAFRHHGFLVCFAAFKNHCSLFPMASTLIPAFKQELAGFDTTKGTIHFTEEKPLPAALVRKIARTRVKENEMRHMQKRSKKR
jgi:uncharacterized protein YdhG (YjbR/CyaY superfamily)